MVYSDQLKDVPDRLETLLSEKRFLNAVVLLSKSLKTINKAELLDISALIELRAYLHSQESAVYDILVEELHNHLYLKSFYCEGRWKPYTRGQTDCKRREPRCLFFRAQCLLLALCALCQCPSLKQLMRTSQRQRGRLREVPPSCTLSFRHWPRNPLWTRFCQAIST